MESLRPCMSMKKAVKPIDESLTTSTSRLYLHWVVVAGVVLLCAVIQSCHPSNHKKAVFTIQQPAQFLQESLAIEKAFQTVVQFYPGNKWQVLDYSQTEAPDKSRDKYLLRNRVDPNKGTVHFIDRQAGVDKVVSVQLSGDTITCEVFRSK